MDVNLPINVEFSIHAASLAIQTLDRVELEEAFIELLHQKALDRQMFYDIMKDHGIDANIQFQLSTDGQISYGLSHAPQLNLELNYLLLFRHI